MAETEKQLAALKADLEAATKTRLVKGFLMLSTQILWIIWECPKVGGEHSVFHVDHSLAARFRKLEPHGKISNPEVVWRHDNHICFLEIAYRQTNMLACFNSFATKSITSAAGEYYNGMFDYLQKQNRNMTAMTELNGPKWKLYV